MAERPRTRYLRSSEGLNLAYQVFGDGPAEMALLPMNWGNVELLWDDPVAARFLHRLGSLGRIVHFDKRGTGMSDPVPIRAIPTVEEWVDDLMSVLDAVGFERPTLIGMDSGATTALVAAATHSSKISDLVLYNAFARLSRADDYPIGIPERIQAITLEEFERDFPADGVAFEVLYPSRSDDRSAREWWGRFGRYSVGLGTAIQMQRAAFELDVRQVLSSVQQPALVIHREGDQYVRAAHGRYLAQHLPNAKYVELPGRDHMFNSGQVDELLAEVEEFLTGARHAVSEDRVLATVLFTDIVDSTARASREGDRGWRHVMDQHDDLVHRTVDRYRGRLIKLSGDGVLAMFDGPARAIRAASEIRDLLSERLGLATRCGLHTGEVELRREDIGGIAVHIGSRVQDLAGPGEVLVSRTVTDLVAGSGLEFEDRGEHELKGVPGRWKLYAVKP